MVLFHIQYLIPKKEWPIFSGLPRRPLVFFKMPMTIDIKSVRSMTFFCHMSNGLYRTDSTFLASNQLTTNIYILICANLLAIYCYSLWSFSQALGYTLWFSLFSLKLNIFPFSASILTFSAQNHLILTYFTHFDIIVWIEKIGYIITILE